MFESMLHEQYGLRLLDARRAQTGAGSDTWFLRCAQGAYVLKFPAAGAIDHPEAEPALCAFLREHGIPACEFLKNRAGGFLSADDAGRVYTVQRRFPGRTPDWHSASVPLLLQSAELLGRIDCALLGRYLDAYCRYGTLNDYDLACIERLYLYQIAVCDYYGQYYASRAQNRAIFLRQARLATRLLQNTAALSC